MLDNREIEAMERLALAYKPNLTIREAELYTGCSYDYLKKEHKAGRLELYKHEKKVFFRKIDLDGWMIPSVPEIRKARQPKRYGEMKFRTG